MNALEKLKKKHFQITISRSPDKWILDWCIQRFGESICQLEIHFADGVDVLVTGEIGHVQLNELFLVFQLINPTQLIIMKMLQRVIVCHD